LFLFAIYFVVSKCKRLAKQADAFSSEIAFGKHIQLVLPSTARQTAVFQPNVQKEAKTPTGTDIHSHNVRTALHGRSL
jgi:hypothetical protein